MLQVRESNVHAGEVVLVPHSSTGVATTKGLLEQRNSCEHIVPLSRSGSTVLSNFVLIYCLYMLSLNVMTIRCNVVTSQEPLLSNFLEVRNGITAVRFSIHCTFVMLVV